jgi:hypothetical protein
MDELRMLREALPEPKGPAQEVVTAGRLALLTDARPQAAALPQAARERAPRPARRWGVRRLAPAGALGVVMVAGITVAQNVGVGSRQGMLPGTQVANARELGDRAAKAAESQPYHRPGPDQWAYVKYRTAPLMDMNTWWTGVSKTLETSELWNRVDGRAEAHIRNGKLVVHDFDADPRVRIFGGPMFNVGNYDTLPTEPAALSHRLHARYRNQVGPTTDGDVFETMSSLLGDQLPPKLRAALFRALPTLHGVTLQRDAVDAVGRHGVAFTMLHDYLREVIIIDPATYRFLGDYRYAVRDYQRPGDAGVIRAGTYITSSAQISAGIVDRPGQRP